MAKQVINIGTAANDGTGDPLRTAFDKANDNFTELYTNLTEVYSYLNVGLFAALKSTETTVVATPNEYTYIVGTFSNSPAVGFTGITDPEPAIKYTGTQTMYFEISAHATLKSPTGNATIYAGIKKNGTLIDESVMALFAKTRGEAYTFGGVCVVSLETDDTIQMVATSDLATDVDFTNLTATIRPFILQ